MIHRFGATFFFSFIAAILFGGCVPTMSLKYTKPDSTTQRKGSISVVVEDQRNTEETGGDSARIGTVRNTFGMPFALRSSPDRQPPFVINELVSDCLEASGYKVVQDKAGIPRLHVALKSFWSDGYQHSRMWLSMSAALKNNKNSQPAWQSDFASNVGVTWVVGFERFDESYSNMLEDTKKQLLSSFNDKKFHQSYTSLK